MQHKRLVIALAIVATLFLALLVSGGRFRADEESINAWNRVDIADPVELIDAYEAKLENDIATPSDAFMEEVGLPPGARDVRYRQGTGVVGFVLDTDVDSAQQRLNGLFRAKGYSAYDLVGVPGATYSKPGGALAWVVALCVEVDGSTSVVLRFEE